MKALLAARAEPNTRDREGTVAAMLVAHPETVEALLEGGADPKLRDVRGRNMFEFPPKNEPVILDCKISRLLAPLAERVISETRDFSRGVRIGSVQGIGTQKHFFLTFSPTCIEKSSESICVL